MRELIPTHTLKGSWDRPSLRGVPACSGRLKTDQQGHAHNKSECERVDRLHLKSWLDRKHINPNDSRTVNTILATTNFKLSKHKAQYVASLCAERDVDTDFLRALHETQFPESSLAIGAEMPTAATWFLRISSFRSARSFFVTACQSASSFSICPRKIAN
jgi:hypothetical protein